MFLLGIGLLLSIIIAVFAVQNAQVVPVQFFAWGFEASLVVVILASALGGAVILGIVAFVRQIGQSIKIWEMRSRIERLEAELKRHAEQAEKSAQAEKLLAQEKRDKTVETEAQ